jgi:diguanylate cyclase (GGDEF)-like protein
MFAELSTFEIHKARRFERPLSVAFLDVDDFKSVNDQFGHDAGDALLQTVARTIKDHIRAAEIIARLGGDEFAIILPETGATAAPLVLEKLRAELLDAVKRGGWPSRSVSG